VAQVEEPLRPVLSVTRTLASKARAVRLAGIAQGKFNIDWVGVLPPLSINIGNLRKGRRSSVVEQRTRNAQVKGSSPFVGLMISRTYRYFSTFIVVFSVQIGVHTS
jgi:hypothetical protein